MSTVVKGQGESLTAALTKKLKPAKKPAAEPPFTEVLPMAMLDFCDANNHNLLTDASVVAGLKKLINKIETNQVSVHSVELNGVAQPQEFTRTILFIEFNEMPF